MRKITFFSENKTKLWSFVLWLAVARSDHNRSELELRISTRKLARYNELGLRQLSKLCPTFSLNSCWQWWWACTAGRGGLHWAGSPARLTSCTVGKQDEESSVRRSGPARGISAHPTIAAALLLSGIVRALPPSLWSVRPIVRSGWPAWPPLHNSTTARTAPPSITHNLYSFLVHRPTQ